MQSEFLITELLSKAEVRHVFTKKKLHRNVISAFSMCEKNVINRISIYVETSAIKKKKNYYFVILSSSMHAILDTVAYFAWKSQSTKNA